MATRLEILIDGEPLDLFDGEESKFYITKLIHDIRSLETRNGDFSKSINIPLTPVNRRLLGGQVPSVARNETNPITQIPVDVLIGGVVVIDDSFLTVGQQSPRSRTLDITIFGGTSLFFVQLSDSPINELNFSELDLEWKFGSTAPRDLDDILGQTTGIVFARSQWYDNASRRLYLEQGGLDAETLLNYIEVGESGFWMYCKTVLEKIFSTLSGITVDMSKMDSLFDRLAFAVPVPIVHNSFEAPNGFFAEVRDNNAVQSFPPNVWTTIQWTNVFSDDDNLFNGSTSFVLTKDGFCTIYCGTLFKTNQQNTSYSINLNKNGSAIFSVFVSCPNPTTYYGFNINTTTDGVIGDVFDVQITPNSSANANVLFTGGAFKIESQGGARGRAVNVSSQLPDISQRDFVKEILKVQNILPVQIDKVVTFEYFESIRTNQVNESIRLDVSKEQSLFGTLPSYGKRNVMKYADNENVERNDMNGEFYVNNVTLVDEVIKLELLFSASDQNTIPFTESARGVTVPNYGMEYNRVNDNKMFVTAGSPDYRTTERNDIKAGDFIWVAGQKRRVLVVQDDFNGTTDLNFPATANDQDWNHWLYTENDVELHLADLTLTGEQMNITDGGEFFTTGSTVVTDFSNQLKFGNENGLIKIYYDLLTQSMEKPFVVQAWAELGVVKFLQTNSTNPIYIEEFDAYFYLNRMDQWKYNQGTRLELIQLKL